MNLIIDQGNTQFKVALFNDNELFNRESFDYSRINHFFDWLKNNSNSSLNLILSSVVDTSIHFNSDFNIINKVVLNDKTPLPIINKYKTPQTLGNDRIANAVGAWILNPHKNSLVIDLGTCIKYDIINQKGEYLGGNIAPGFKMRYQSMHHFTDKLPLIDQYDLTTEYGVDTKSSLQVGVQLGIMHEINGFIDRYTAQFNGLTIFMTGGDIKYFDKSFKKHIFANPNLTLIGLNEILRYNV
jgi:type III pantothenate kinase